MFHFSYQNASEIKKTLKSSRWNDLHLLRTFFSAFSFHVLAGLQPLHWALERLVSPQLENVYCSGKKGTLWTSYAAHHCSAHIASKHIVPENPFKMVHKMTNYDIPYTSHREFLLRKGVGKTYLWKNDILLCECIQKQEKIISEILHCRFELPPS